MSELLENAIQSIQLGLQDYGENDPRRPISAVRNFYAGVLLLGKQCLLNAAPDADPMEVLASTFQPQLDDCGGVTHKPKGLRTIDLEELRQRFKSFKLMWPDGEISSLQKLRNGLEHYHPVAPKEAFRQAIAECFPLVTGFFEILELDPSEALGASWEVMLAEEAFFRKQKEDCNASLRNLPWGANLTNTEHYECPECGSSLICQMDATNSVPEEIEGRCKACGHKFTPEDFVGLIVDSEYGVDDYISVKDGGEPIINDCPQCYLETYVSEGDLQMCYYCRYSIGGKCALCSAALGAHNISVNNSSFCSYCDHVMSKDD